MNQVDQALVSIVIPIFNKRRFLRKCLSSIFHQSYSNIEVIVVDDCSTDSSMEEVERLVVGHTDCKLVRNTRNMGHLKSRYVGIDHACGKYIAFVDADDWMEPQALQQMVEAMERLNVDLVQIRHQRRMKGIAVKYQEHFDSALTGRRIDGEEFRTLASYVGIDSYITPSCWDKLYLTRKLREAPRLEFKQFWGEDQVFNIQYLRESRSMAFVDYVGYNYRWGGETSSSYKYSALREYKYVHQMKRMLGQNETYLNEELEMLLRYYVRSLVSEIGFTREAAVMAMEEELKDPLWRTIIPDLNAAALVDEEMQNLQRNRTRYLIKRLLR